MTRMNNFHSSIGYTSVCVCVRVCEVVCDAEASQVR